MAMWSSGSSSYTTQDPGFDPGAPIFTRPDDIPAEYYTPGGAFYWHDAPDRVLEYMNRTGLSDVGIPTPGTPTLVGEGIGFDPAYPVSEQQAGVISVPNNMTDAANFGAALGMRGPLSLKDAKALWPGIGIPEDAVGGSLLNGTEPYWWKKPQIAWNIPEPENDFGEALGAALQIASFASGLGGALNFLSPGMGFNFAGDLFGSFGGNSLFGGDSLFSGAFGGTEAAGSGLSAPNWFGSIGGAEAAGSSGLGLSMPGMGSATAFADPLFAGGTSWNSPFSSPDWFSSGAQMPGASEFGTQGFADSLLTPKNVLKGGSELLKAQQQSEAEKQAQQEEEERRRRMAKIGEQQRTGALQSLSRSRYSTPMSMQTGFGRGPFGRI